MYRHRPRGVESSPCGQRGEERYRISAIDRRETARDRAIREWRRKKRNGETTGPVAHLKYGKLSRPVLRSLDLERPPLSDLTLDELDRLEQRL